MIFQPEVADALSSDSDDEDNAALAAFQAAQATLTAALSTLQNAEELEAAQDEEDAMMEDDFSDEDMEFEANFDGRGSVPGRQNLNRDLILHMIYLFGTTFATNQLIQKSCSEDEWACLDLCLTGSMTL